MYLMEDCLCCSFAMSQELDDLDDSLPESDNMTETEGNKDAARALFRVKQKLDGYEEGEMRSLQGQVSK